jgi:putative ABC transport system ATP-binding protein
MKSSSKPTQLINNQCNIKKMIHLKNISKIYDKQGQEKVLALNGINLEIGKGEFVAIIGSSGSGKSTMMNIIGLLDKPSMGNYYLENQAVENLSGNRLAEIRNQKIGFVFQSFHLLPRTSALENVELPLIYSTLKNTKELALESLKKVGLSDRVNHKPNELSGGQQQRVAIARALVTNPEIILADEPTGNLDSESGKGIMELFVQLNQQGKTIILITHDPDIASQAKRIIKIKDGNIIEDRN